MGCRRRRVSVARGERVPVKAVAWLAPEAENAERAERVALWRTRGMGAGGAPAAFSP